MTGITHWVDQEDVELLPLDKYNLKCKDGERGITILQFIETAYRNKLGLVKGIDMREGQLALLPSYKLISAERWESINRNGLLFAI